MNLSEKESIDLKYNKVEIDHPYFYKELCSILGATYYGTSTRSVARQLDAWSKYMLFEKADKKICVKKIYAQPKWVTDKMVLLREGFRAGTYNRQILDLLMYRLMKAEYVNRRDNNGSIEEWKRISMSTYQWKIILGLLSPQLKRYSKKMYKSEITQILLFNFSTLANQIYCRTIDKFKEAEDRFVFGEETKFAYIDLSKPIKNKERKNDDAKSVIKIGDEFYKTRTHKMGPEMEQYIANARLSILKEMGCTLTAEAFDKGLGEKYNKEFKIFMDGLYYDKKGHKFVSYGLGSGKSTRGKDSDKHGPSYKVINFWESQVIEARVNDIVAVIETIKNELVNSGVIDKDDKLGGGSGFDNYFKELQETLNKRVLDNLYKKIDEHRFIPKEEELFPRGSRGGAAPTEEEVYQQVAALVGQNKKLFDDVAQSEDLTEEEIRAALKKIATIFGGVGSENRRQAKLINLTTKQQTKQ